MVTRRLYRSQFADKAKQAATAGKSPGKLMGPPKKAQEEPFLSKGAGNRRLEEQTRMLDVEKGPKMVSKPPVPKHTERPPMRTQESSKDYVRDNYRHAVTLVPQQPKHMYQDGSGGRFAVEDSGLVPKYTKREDFGKTPAYLAQRKQEGQRQATQQRTMRAQAGQDRYIRITDAERYVPAMSQQLADC